MQTVSPGYGYMTKNGNRAYVKTCVDPLDGSVSLKKNNYRQICNIFLCLWGGILKVCFSTRFPVEEWVDACKVGKKFLLTINFTFLKSFIEDLFCYSSFRSIEFKQISPFRNEFRHE